ncbi:MAG: hypothetical protein IPL46_08130 [Saprospiraceae bacterium]|nr:hypothetical protein [Saprospiraceae bacterium]
MKKIEEFWTVSDSGTKYLMSIYAKMIDQTNKDNPTAPPREGLKSIKTSQGFHCNRIDNDTFKVVETGEIVRRVI